MTKERTYPCWEILRPRNYTEKNVTSSPDNVVSSDYYVETYFNRVRNVYDSMKGEAKIDIPRDIFENNKFKEMFNKHLKSVGLCIDNLTYLSTVVSVNIVKLED